MSFTPYLFFVGTCREAMNTYQSIFGGELDIVTAADMPDAPEDAPADAVMHAALTLPSGGHALRQRRPQRHRGRREERHQRELLGLRRR